MDRQEAMASLRQIFEATGACGISADDVVDNETGTPGKEGVFFASTLPDGAEVLYGWAVEEVDIFEAVPVLRFSELDTITYSRVDPEDEDSIDIYFELSGGRYRVHCNLTRFDGEMSSSYEVLIRPSKRWVHRGVAVQLMREFVEDGPSGPLVAMDGLVERCLRDRAPEGEAMMVLERCLRKAALDGSALSASQYVLTALLCDVASSVFDMDLALAMLEDDRVLLCARESILDHFHLIWSPDDLSRATADLEAAALSHSLGMSYQMSPLWREPTLERFRRAELYWQSLHEPSDEGGLSQGPFVPHPMGGTI